MDEREYRSNSNKSKETENQNDDFNSNTVRRRKRSGLRNSLGLGDPGSVRNYIWLDVLIPTFKRALSDIVCNGFNMLLGEPNRGRYNGDYDRDSRPNYRKYYQDGRDRDRKPSRDPGLDHFDDLEFRGRGRAERALYDLQAEVDQQGSVSVGRLFDIVHQNCPYTYWDYGWTDLDDVQVVRAHDDWYFLDLPPARYIGNIR